MMTWEFKGKQNLKKKLKQNKTKHMNTYASNTLLHY